MFDYTGKVVAVTGASSGLGKQMAEGFAQQGANLVLMARRVERLEASRLLVTSPAPSPSRRLPMRSRDTSVIAKSSSTAPAAKREPALR